MKTGDVLAVPYDMPIIGYGAKNIGTLRLWQTESLHEIDFTAFNNQHYAQASADKNKAEDITKFLYPNDDRREGKQMRIKQQYVLVSASCRICCAPTRSVTAMITRGSPRNTPCS